MTRAFRLTGWHVLAGLVVFFGITFAVDGLMIVDAYQTDPGEVADNPYEVGIEFNSTLAREQAQAALGWRMTEGLAGPDRVVVTIADRSGAPLAGLRVKGTAERPATAAGEHALVFRETAPGAYAAPTPALAGAWDVQVVARDAQGHEFDAERRLVGP